MKKLLKGVSLKKAIATGATPAEWQKANGKPKVTQDTKK